MTSLWLWFSECIQVRHQIVKVKKGESPSLDIDIIRYPDGLPLLQQTESLVQLFGLMKSEYSKQLRKIYK